MTRISFNWKGERGEFSVVVNGSHVGTLRVGGDQGRAIRRLEAQGKCDICNDVRPVRAIEWP